jgi:phospholipid/cholesterol/gamma-HCH transport system ATP-binding protein
MARTGSTEEHQNMTMEGEAATPRIRVRGLRKSFGAQAVLDGIDLDIAVGARLILLGLSGSGKTILAKCLLGLVEPDAGSIEIDGVETVGIGSREREALMRRVGVLFQNGALFDSLRNWENIAFGPMQQGSLTRAAARPVALEALAYVGLDPDVATLFPSELSGGMQKRVALARAIIGTPQFLILDNPTAGLDPIMTAIIDEFVLGSLARLQASALIITHDIASAERIGTDAAMLARGRIAWRGPVAALTRSDDPEVADYVRHSGYVPPDAPDAS